MEIIYVFVYEIVTCAVNIKKIMPCGRTESKTDVFENFGRLRVPTKHFKTFAKKKTDETFETAFSYMFKVSYDKGCVFTGTRTKKQISTCFCRRQGLA